MPADILTLSDLLQRVSDLLLSGLSSLLGIGLLLLVVFIIVALYRRLRYKTITTARWFHYFDCFHVVGVELYDEIEKAVQSKKIHSLKISRVSYPEHDPFFSNNRIYLRITWHKTVFEICSGPIGHSYFISCRKGRKAGLIHKLIPFVGAILERAVVQKTYYQQDAEEALEQNIRNILQKIIKDCTDVRVKRRSVTPEQVVSDMREKYMRDLMQAGWAKGVKSKPYEWDNRVY